MLPCEPATIASKLREPIALLEAKSVPYRRRGDGGKPNDRAGLAAFTRL